jgi:hypothetical protein
MDNFFLVYFESTFYSLITLLENRKDFRTYIHSSLKLGVRMSPPLMPYHIFNISLKSLLDIGTTRFALCGYVNGRCLICNNRRLVVRGHFVFWKTCFTFKILKSQYGKKKSESSFLLANAFRSGHSGNN